METQLKFDKSKYKEISLIRIINVRLVKEAVQKSGSWRSFDLFILPTILLKTGFSLSIFNNVNYN